MAIQDSQDIPIYSIGSAARKLGVSVHTLRLYEREGLMLSFKTPTKRRLYSESDIERLKCIRRAITEEKIGIAGIRHLQAMIPCWEIVQCAKERREACPAYHGHEAGCWTYNYSTASCSVADCRHCAVYRLSTDCSAIKDFIVRHSETGSLASSAD